MNDAKLQMAREWIIKAKHDLESAKKLALGNNPILDTAIYHCQQSGEKAIKGFLLLHDAPIQKTHDITALVAQASEFEKQFVSLLDDGEILTPYATLYRYPLQPVREPSLEQFSQAIRSAENLYQTVLRFAPELSHL
ncbi:MAG: HEPN domain-containing protein [Candidatus Sumerlaeota bacterium]|nr:HEPN domain-containing protein [Candidatus Sumerlaeota bacterium]